MIELTNHDGRTELVNPTAIARVTEASNSSQWHGIRCLVRLFDGTVIECTQTIEAVQAKLLEEAAKT